MIKPYKGANILQITQGFHDGHKGIDIYAPYGTSLVAPEACRVVGLWGNGPLEAEPIGLKQGFGIKMLGLETGNIHLYWHTLAVFPIAMGDIVKAGQIVAFIGNSGDVRAGGVYVPLSERNVAPYKGTHLHQELWTSGGIKLNPSEWINWWHEPTYSTFEWAGAWLTVLARMSRIISK